MVKFTQKIRTIKTITIIIFFSISGAIGLGKRYNEQYISHFIIDINCTGTEETIWDCPRDNVNVCSSDKTALIICQGIIHELLHCHNPCM